MTIDPQRTVEERIAIRLAAHNWCGGTEEDLRWDERTPHFRDEYLTLAREVIALAAPAAARVVSAAPDGLRDQIVPRAVRPIDIEHDELMARAEAEHQARVAADQARKAADRAAVLLVAIRRVEAERDATDVNVAEYPRYDWKERAALEGALRVLRRLAAETQQQPGRSDVGTEFVNQADQPDEAGLAAFETDLAEAQQQADTETPLTALEAREKTIRDHTLALHQIGEQLSQIESWFWEHLADVREAARQELGGPLPDDVEQQPAAADTSEEPQP